MEPVEQKEMNTATRNPALALLGLRLLLFAAAQGLFALGFLAAGSSSPWQASTGLWPFAAALGSLVCGLVVAGLLKREGSSYREMIRFQKGSVGKDVLIAIGLFLLAGPIGYLPSPIFGKMIFGEAETTTRILFPGLPVWAGILAVILFPLLVALTELPAYYGYIMPRLEAQLKNRFWAVLLPAFFLAAQHIALPLVFDGRFIAWRLLMFLPFALFFGVALRWRPRLLPYFMVGHWLIDLATAVMLLPGMIPPA